MRDLLTYNEFGEGGRDRTSDLLLKRQMLYRLSYTLALIPLFLGESGFCSKVRIYI